MRFIAALLCVFLTFATATARAEQLTVFAAASLSDALRELAVPFEAETGIQLRFNFGGSGALARQLREGAPGDVFFSADQLRMDQLEAAGLLLPSSRMTVLYNSLVLVTDPELESQPKALSELLERRFRRLAIGEPATVPAGTYAKASLLKAGLWGALEGKCVPLPNVRAVLAAVESGNVEAGFVYRTDALLSKKVHLALELPTGDTGAISYPLAVLKESTRPVQAKLFADWLLRDEAQKVFKSYGFSVAP